jgi:hypothetical protein
MGPYKTIATEGYYDNFVIFNDYFTKTNTDEVLPFSIELSQYNGFNHNKYMSEKPEVKEFPYAHNTGVKMGENASGMIQTDVIGVYESITKININNSENKKDLLPYGAIEVYKK